MRGLVSYDDDSPPPSSDVHPESSPVANNGSNIPRNLALTNERDISLKEKVFIRKPKVAKPHIRRQFNGDEDEKASNSSAPPPPPMSREQSPVPIIPAPQNWEEGQQEGEASTSTLPDQRNVDENDEISTIRRLLQPPPTPGLDDWGIPPPPPISCDSAVEEKFLQFRAYKTHPTQPKHFNDSLMANRSFRNPHLYAKLVEFVDVDESATNFPKDLWDPWDIKAEWYADSIAAQQKAAAEEQPKDNGSGKSNRQIAFTSSQKRQNPMQELGGGYNTGTFGRGGPRRRLDLGGAGVGGPRGR